MAGESSCLSSEGDTGFSWAEGRGSGWTQPLCKAGDRLHGSRGAGLSLAASKASLRMFGTGTRVGFVCIIGKHLVMQKRAHRLEERRLM